jgi:hypothetical protein
MFEGSGSKVKSVAKVFFVLILISMFAYGIISCRSISAISGKKVTGTGFLTFLLIAGIGSVSAWISGVMIHAFGEMVENTGHISCIELEAEKLRKSQERLEKNVEQMEKNMEKMEKGLQQKLTPELPSQTVVDMTGAVRICPICHSPNKETDRYCSKCHQFLGGDIKKEQQAEPAPKIEIPVVRNKVCPKCKKDNPADYLYCQYCGERLS